MAFTKVTAAGIETSSTLVVQNINTSGIVTANSLSIGSTQIVSSARQLQNIVSLDATTTATIESAIASGPNTFTNLQITGLSTFTNGPVLIGSATSTGTVSQPLQVTGGAYVSGNTGIGITNPESRTHIAVSGATTTALTLDHIGGNAVGANFKVNFGGYATSRIVFDFVGAEFGAASPSGSHGMNYVSGRTNFSNHFFRNASNVTQMVMNNSGNLLIGTETDSGTASQRLQVTGGAYISGNLGVGITNPAQKLDVSGSTQTGIVYTRVSNTFGSTGSNESGTGLQFFGWDAGVTANIKSLRAGTNFSPSYLSFETFGGNGTLGGNSLAERVRIDGFGNVGIGITNPTSILSVGSQTLLTNTDNRIVLAGRFTSGIGTFASFYFKNSQDSGGSSASIRALRVGDNYGTELAFFTQTSGGASGGDGVEAIRIGRSGSVGIGITNPQSLLHIAGQFQSTSANSTATGGGQIYLNGATGNRIDFNINGIAAPTFTTRSAGTKIVLYPSLSASLVDYAFGIDGNTFWSSVDGSVSSFKWYAGTTNIATLSGSGNLTLSGTVTASLNGNASTSSTFSTGRTNYKGVTDGAVAGQLMWKNYGNGHTIFDASNGSSPDGTPINNVNAQEPWGNTYPTLMGWNGTNTFGVRVDSARVSDSSTASSTATNISNTGTVTLASATESNSIYITQPSYTNDQPVKLLNFDWYGNTWSLGNIRSASSSSNGFGIFSSGTERARFTTGGLNVSGTLASTGILSIATANSSGTLASRNGFGDFIGYNSSYGSYIGGGVGNASRYLYAGGFFNDGTAVRTLLHSGNLIDYSVSTYGIPDTGGSPSFIFLGTWTTGQAGHTLYMRVVSHAGYNALVSQNQVTELYFKTSNSSSNNGGFFGDALAFRNIGLGYNSGAPSIFRIVQVSGSSYQIYASFSVFSSASHYTVQAVPGTIWTNSSTIVSAPTGTYIDVTPSSSPLSDGTNAGGTCGINVTGNAATATTASSSPLLSALGNYVWSASTLPTSYNMGIQCSFVQPSNGWQSYGSVLNMQTYSGGGGSLQLYVPYSPTYGGTGLQVRFGNYDVSTGNSWTSWKTLLASDNYSSYSSFTGTVAISGSTNLPTIGGGSIYLASGFGSPTVGKLYIGDGTGWQFLMASRTSSTDTTRFAFSDTGNFSATGNVTAYSSDRRLKENLKHIQSPIEKIQKLNGYTFDWNEKSKELGFTPKHEKDDIGLIAQEVEEVLPQAVAPAPFDTERTEDGYMSKSGENYLTIQYERLVPLLVEAIKEQQEQINNLKNEIVNLKTN